MTEIINAHLANYPADVNRFHPNVTAFCHNYYLMSRERLPEIDIRQPGPRESFYTWIDIPVPYAKFDDVSLYHKLTESRVDFHFVKMSKRIAEIKEQFGPYIAPGMEIRVWGRSAIIRQKVPNLNAQQPFEDQAELAYQGMVAALRLLRVFERGVKDRPYVRTED